jgi:hypothetical protein
MNVQINTTTTRPAVNTMLWSGRIISALAIMFLIFDSVIKVLTLAPAVEATTALGYPESVVMGLGLLELVCLGLYIIPRTAVLGAIMMTGYLGGAIATHVRNGSDPFSIIFPIILGAFLWGGLLLRNADLRTLLFGRR